MAQEHNKKFEKRNNSNRHFSEEFKRSKVDDLINKRILVKDLAKIYDISRRTVYKWIYLYSRTEKETKMVVQMDSESFKYQQSLIRIAELERIIGQKQMQIDVLEKTLEFAGKEQGIDVKKKTEPMSSNGLENHPKNTRIQ